MRLADSPTRIFRIAGRYAKYNGKVKLYVEYVEGESEEQVLRDLEVGGVFHIEEVNLRELLSRGA